MPPRAKRKLGYNWRARQSLSETCDRSSKKEGEGEDPNALILPPKPKKSLKVTGAATSKRKRLGCKQKKRLLKILEAKEKKTKRAELLTELSSLSLPSSQHPFLLPSTSLSSSRPPAGPLGSMPHSGSEISGSVSGWRVRRRRRKRRQLRAEKEVWSPHKVTSHLEVVGDEEEEEEEEGVQMIEMEVEGAEREGPEGEEEEVEEEKVREERTVTGEEANVAVETGVRERRVAVFVQLKRPGDVQEVRAQLPVVAEEGRIMESVSGSPVTVLCGETGSGKTTQLPQFLYEHGYTLPNGPCGGGMIGVTEPRRVAAVSMSHRVAYEMGLSQRQVSYQIRYEGNTTEDTVIKFMTDGVLLREIEQDLLLQRYSVVVVDEAHERSVFTDILLGLLSRIIPLREKSGRPLKLVVMSATLRVEDFTSNPLLFPSPPPTLSVESRQFPVTVHFSRRTPTSYVREAYLKTCKIHRRLPPGHVLVFLTGQREVLRLCRMLKDTFPCTQSTGEEREEGGGRERRRRGDVDLDKYPLLPEVDRTECEDEEGEEEGEETDWKAEVSAHDKQLPMLVLPLYSLLPPEKQAEVFRPVSEGVRLCVVATNVAETSITIPHVKYVVDTGKVKRRYYDKVTGISTFRVEWVSQASANQRAGRAGRTQPGHCYRLYSSAVFQNQFSQFSQPEICSRPVDDLVLQMKALGIERVAHFPFPTPPSPEALQAAEMILEGLGALSSDGRLTDLGRTMSRFPVSPRYGKMLAVGHQYNCLPHIISLVAALSVKELVVQTDHSWRKGEEEGRGEGGVRWSGLAALRRLCAGKVSSVSQSALAGTTWLVVGRVPSPGGPWTAADSRGSMEPLQRENRVLCQDWTPATSHAGGDQAQTTTHKLRQHDLP
jgi:ATP-dependent RNA helicase DHX37/DHR1